MIYSVIRSFHFIIKLNVLDKNNIKNVVDYIKYIFHIKKLITFSNINFSHCILKSKGLYKVGDKDLNHKEAIYSVELQLKGRYARHFFRSYAGANEFNSTEVKRDAY